MAASTVLNYLPRKSVVHALNGTTKLAFFLLFTFASMITYDTRVLIILMAVSFGIFKFSRIKLREVRFMMVLEKKVSTSSTAKKMMAAVFTHSLRFTLVSMGYSLL